MMKRMLLCVGLMGLVSNAQAANGPKMPRSESATLILIGGGCLLSIGLGFVGYKCLDHFKDRSNTAILGSACTVLGLGTLAIEKYIQSNEIDGSFNRVVKIGAAFISLGTFAGLQRNRK